MNQQVLIQENELLASANDLQCAGNGVVVVVLGGGEEIAQDQGCLEVE